MPASFAVIVVRAQRHNEHPGREKAFLVFDCFNDHQQAVDYVAVKAFQYANNDDLRVVATAAARALVDDENGQQASPKN